ncbi:PEP-CTERM sorting domain-containing protein [Anabaena cylindrica UHCC 0172]|uniref:PEP-CTERM sorting domain-containing protein n=1 Tax=Anabaena cylindrica TaxID=1165 RepID=UPI002B1EBC5A|nr:PEP-CTERM sorting domain-containing protein [Anabaena cylindrica]MEA5551651.1 PEP-CTERM sorting domain-containing protein [Anabaena cylindrica UHCC 0172]
MMLRKFSGNVVSGIAVCVLLFSPEKTLAATFTFCYTNEHNQEVGGEVTLPEPQPSNGNGFGEVNFNGGLPKEYDRTTDTVISYATNTGLDYSTSTGKYTKPDPSKELIFGLGVPPGYLKAHLYLKPLPPNSAWQYSGTIKTISTPEPMNMLGISITFGLGMLLQKSKNKQKVKTA